MKQWNELMKLPPDVELHEDIRLLIYRPHGSMNEEAVNKIVSVIGDLEGKLQELSIDSWIPWATTKLS